MRLKENGKSISLYTIFTSDNLSQFSQTLPVVELKPKKQAGGVKHEDARNDNGVRGPMAEQQIKMSGRWRKRSDEEHFPSDVVSRKARDVGGMKPQSNEKSQVDVKSQRNEKAEPDVVMALEKITLYQQKICQYVDYLREIIDDPPEVDDISDLRKRQQRAAEFANRFARNHLYQIGRAVSGHVTQLFLSLFLSSRRLRRQRRFA